jgi:hypothetical protein
LSWGGFDRFRNFFNRPRWLTPDTQTLNKSLEEALKEEATIIFAHCGLHYFAGGVIGRLLEHSDFKSVRRYLTDYPVTGPTGGRCFANCSALATPFREPFFKKVAKLPEESLLFGSDFPTPVFELSAGRKEVWRDFKAVLRGDLGRIIIPQDNLLDVNYRELRNAFPGHPMFTNFDRWLV